MVKQVPQSSVNHRVKKDIDGRSYIQTYHLDGTSDFVLFIHGVLGSHKETWQDTPIQLMAEQALAKADFGSFGYETTLFDSRTTRTPALQLNTWMRTHLIRYERIYIIAHSMGGLITREACGLLARSEHRDDRDLLGKIRHGFFVAVPIAGSATAAWLQKVPFLRRINKKLPILAEPRVAGQHLHDFYEESIRFIGPAAPRPRFSLFTGSSDGLVAEPPEWVLTKDDRHEGVIEGTHASIKLDQTSNSTLLRRIVQLIDADRSLGTSGLSVRLARTAARGPKDVLVLACSSTKSTAGEGAHSGNEGVLDLLADASVRADACNLRSKVKALMEAGRIEGREFREGNRRSRQQNMNLLLGPDFGGLANGPHYLPAYRRYMGRSFQATPAEWERFLSIPEAQRPTVLVVSGLYGLCRIDEHIQNYDCHLSDVDVDTRTTLQAHWSTVLTDLLIAHLKCLQQGGQTVGRVLNLLAEDVYSQTLDWAKLKQYWPVWHQRFECARGRDALENVGVWVRNVVLQPAALEHLHTGVFRDDPKFANGDRVVFYEE